MTGRKPKKPCYESRIFLDWRYGAGAYHTGDRAGTPIHISNVEVGKFAILTTRFPDERESERRIIGLFQIGRIKRDPETVVFATPESQIRLPLEEAKELYYWAYLNTKGGIPDWRTGLFRYLEDEQVHRILADVAETVRDENTKTKIKNLIIQEFGNAALSPAIGCLPEKSINRPQNIARHRKYGPGGEGEEHKKLKIWLSEHPNEIGLADVNNVDIEHRFLSGDSADLVFTHNDKYAVVEVETVDPLPGAHQAIKYRALLCAEKGFALDSDKVQAILVAWQIPNEVKVFCEKYGIDYQTHRL